MSIKQQLSEYERLTTMSTAPFFILGGNGKELTVQSDSATGVKIAQYINNKRDSVLVELKEEVGNL